MSIVIRITITTVAGAGHAVTMGGRGGGETFGLLNFIVWLRLEVRNVSCVHVF